LDIEAELGRPSAILPTDVRVLIVEGYKGDLGFIRPATGTLVGHSGPSWLLKGEGFVGMRFADESDAAMSETFLLFDLRNRRPSGRRVLESVTGHPDLDKTVPHVILATSREQVYSRLGIDPKNCWQLRNCASPADLTAALRYFLHEWPKKDSPKTSPPSMP
jgi:hypothetical protein